MSFAPKRLVRGLAQHLEPRMRSACCYYSCMLIRPKLHWLALGMTAWFFILGTVILAIGKDTFMVPIYLVVGSALAIMWSSTYTTLSDGVLINHVVFFRARKFPVEEIARIAAHKNNGKPGYGTVVNIFSRNGQKLTLQPNHPEPFLTALHRLAPQAEYAL